MGFFRKILVFCAFFFCFARGADAHSVTLSVYAEGDKICGETFFSSGKPVAGAEIKVCGTDGCEFGTVRTNADGEFSFSPQQAVPHVFSIKTGDGHAATITLSRENLPKHLRNASKAAPEGTVPASVDKVNSGSQSTAKGGSSGTGRTDGKLSGGGKIPDLTREDLVKLIDYAVEVNVNKLSRKIDQYERERRMGDILGGVGYIFGIFGFYLLLRRRKDGNV